MVGSSNIKSLFLYGPKVHDFTTLFEHNFNVQEADDNLLNKYAIYKVNEYQVMNIEDYNLWGCIRIEVVKFEAEYFDQFSNATLKIIRDYRYPYGFWIELNISLDKTFKLVILEAVAVE